jgi:hypothetical protein
VAQEKKENPAAKTIAALANTGMSPTRAFEVYHVMTEDERAAVNATDGQVDAGEKIRQILNRHADRVMAGKAADAVSDLDG